MTGTVPPPIDTSAPDIRAADAHPEPAAVRGETVINDSVVAKIAGLATRDVPGVHALGGGAARALGAIREAISSTDHSQGVTVQVGAGEVTVDVTLVAGYPVPLQQVADGVRSAVILAIETLTGLQVSVVNVTINDVHLPEEAAGTGEAPVQ
jgi:uncharacterized alkaline shock family protein YloU